MMITGQRSRATIGMVTIALVFASLIGFVAPAQAVDNQGNAGQRVTNTFYAYLKAGETLSVVIPAPGKTGGLTVWNEQGEETRLGLTAPKAETDGVWRFTIHETDDQAHFKYELKVLSGRTEMKGRIWVYEDLLAQRWGNGTNNTDNLQYYGVSDLGYVYDFKLQAMNGVDSRIALRASGGAPNSQCNVEDRSFESANVDCGDKYRLFFEDPRNSGLPEYAKMGNTTIPVLPKVVNESQIQTGTSVEFAPNTNKIGGSFVINSHPGFSGTAELQIDTNNNGRFDEAVDVKKSIVVNGGTSKPFAWDGKNSSGSEVRDGAKARVVIDRIAEAHLIMMDVELLGGLTMTRLNGNGAPNSTMYWDDSKLTEPRGGTPTRVKVCLTGCNSNVSGGVHGWDRGVDAIPNDPQSSSWGDGRFIGNWSYQSVNAVSEIIPLPALRKLTFDANGGAIKGVTAIERTHGSAWGTLPTATAANQDFNGWFTAKTGGTEMTAATAATSNLTVYARWTPTDRTLTFDTNGGTLSGAKTITKPHGSAWGTLSTATLANKDFTGWYTAKTGGTKVTATTVATGNITVYAQWTPTPRTLTFDANGGTLSGAKTITKPHGIAWGTLATASLANNDFQGWYTAKTGGTQVTAATVAAGNITVYARWTPTERTLTFDANGGTLSGAKTITKGHGSPWGTLSTATLANNDFEGWYTAKTGGTQVTAATVAAGNITVYARWTPTDRTLTFDTNGGTLSGAKSITKPHGSPWGTLSTATLENKDFTGWYTAKTGGTEVTVATVATGNITVYAQWTPTPRTLTFDTNGGVIDGAKSITKPHGSAWGTLSTATLTNNDFQGWYTAKTGGTQVTAATVATGNITVYAQWKPTVRTLTFDANGGAVNGAKSITKPHGTAWGTLSTATLENKDFTGWYTAKTGGTQVTATTVAAGDLTVYAQWKPTMRTLTFDATGGTVNGAASITQPHGTAWGTLSGATLANNDFQGWFTAKTGGTQVTATTVAAGNITVYAQWKPTMRTLSFDANGGAIDGVTTITQPHGTAWGTLPAATLVNNDFQGWFTAKTGGNQVTAATVATGDLTVYAQWKPTMRTLTFDANGGALNGAKSITKPHGTVWGALSTATLENKDFTGWYTAKTGGTQVTSATVATGNITVYAQWKPTMRTLTFDPTGGTVNGAASITQPHGTAWGALPAATAPSKVFLGWYTTDTGGTQVTASTVATASITVYAQWRPAKFNVVFDGNAQTGEITGATASLTVEAGCTDCRLTANGFTKTTGAPELIDHETETAEINSTFLGWSLDPSSRTGSIPDRAVAGGLSQTDGATVVLYAIWDDAPRFLVAEYPDRFFTLTQAQAGEVTEEELLRTVVATDQETNPLDNKTKAQVQSSGSDVGVTLYDYEAGDYTSLTDSAVVTATYKVKDTAGHAAFLRIRVTVSSEVPLPQDPIRFLRGISPEYADKASAEGGLSDESLWRTDPTRQEALAKALDTGDSTTYCLDSAAIAELRTQIGRGLGNSETSDGLAASTAIIRDKGACE